MSVSTAERRRLSSDEFRDIIGRFASGVTVITAEHEERPFGTTASAVSSLSLDPPMLLVCLNRTSSTGQAIAAARHFAVNILGEDQADAAMQFAGKGDKFAGVKVARGVMGEPLLEEALANFECRVVEEVIGRHAFGVPGRGGACDGPSGRAAGVLPRSVRALGAGAGRRCVPRHPGARDESRAADRRAAEPRRRGRRGGCAARVGLSRADEAVGRGAGDAHARG